MWIMEEHCNMQKEEQRNVETGRTTLCGTWKINVMWNVDEQRYVEKRRTT